MVLIWYHADMGKKRFFSGQMRARLRSFRLAAKLSQDELALRMGYFGPSRRRLVERLENGRIAEPTVKMVARYLQGCGARWHSIVDLLESVPPVKLDIVKVRSRKFTEAVKQKTEEQAQAVNQAMAYMRPERPVSPERRKQGTKRYSEYRLIANVIEQAVTEVLRTTELSMVHYGAYQAVGRYCLSTLWKLSKDLPGSRLKQQLRKLIKPELEAMHKEWQNWGLDMKIVLRVQRRVTELYPSLIQTLRDSLRK
jgi:transcriptional regulator with XRE-family HTH domain